MRCIVFNKRSMKTFWNYLLLEYKKSIKVLPKAFGSTLLMSGFLIAGIGLISFLAFQSHVFSKVDVAVVVPEEQKQMRSLLKMVETMESVESICNFLYMEEAEAMEALEQGNVCAAIILPEDFYEDIDTGYNTPLTVYVAGDPPLNQLVFQELLTDGVSLLRTAEAGVYATLHAAKIYTAQMPLDDIGDYIAQAYMMEAFRRNDIFAESIYSSLGNISLYQYYFVTVCNMILLMFGMNFGFLYRKQAKAVEEQLKIAGIGRWGTASVKICVMSMILWLLGIIIYAAGVLLSHLTNRNFLFWEFGTLVSLLLLSISIAVYLHMLYCLSGHNGQGAYFVFACNALMLLCSGCIVPAVYLPQIAAKAGAVLPLSLWNQYAVEAFFTYGSVRTIWEMIGISVIMMGLGAIVSWKNT